METVGFNQDMDTTHHRAHFGSAEEIRAVIDIRGIDAFEQTGFHTALIEEFAGKTMQAPHDVYICLIKAVERSNIPDKLFPETIKYGKLILLNCSTQFIESE